MDETELTPQSALSIIKPLAEFRFDYCPMCGRNLVEA